MHESFETPGHVTAVIENEMGSVSVTAAGEGTSDVSLEPASAGADELIERARVECVPTGDGYELRVLLPHQHGLGFRRNRVTVRVTIPAGGDADVSTASASIELKGAIGAATLRTASGTMDTGDVAGDLRASAASGRLLAAAVGGELRFKSASGHVRAASARGLDVQMVSGATDIGELAGDATVSTVSGRVVIGSCGRGHIRVKAVSGAITVGIPRGVTFRVDADAASGRVRTDIPLGDAPPRGGATDLTISAKTVSGTVTIERSMRPADAESFAG